MSLLKFTSTFAVIAVLSGTSFASNPENSSPEMDHSKMEHSVIDQSVAIDDSDMDHSNMDHSKMDHGNMNHNTMGQSASDDVAISPPSMNASNIEHSEMDHGDMDHSNMDHGDMDHSTMDHSAHDMSDMDGNVASAPIKSDSSIITAKVNGLVCDFCAQALRKVFKKEDAVNDINVDLDSGEVIIGLNPGQTLEDERVKKLIRKSGYSLVSIERKIAE